MSGLVLGMSMWIWKTAQVTCSSHTPKGHNNSNTAPQKGIHPAVPPRQELGLLTSTVRVQMAAAQRKSSTALSPVSFAQVW